MIYSTSTWEMKVIYNLNVYLYIHNYTFFSIYRSHNGRGALRFGEKEEGEVMYTNLKSRFIAKAQNRKRSNKTTNQKKKKNFFFEGGGILQSSLYHHHH